MDTSAAPGSSPPHFMVVGSPRSGTTLVQRLASELQGVQVTMETNFFPAFYLRVLRYEHFPLSRARVQVLLREYMRRRKLKDFRLDVEAIANRLGECCDSPWSLFSEVVTDLAPDADLIGEKTPHHLRWWRPISHVSPFLKFVFVLRDPRAVVASTVAAPFAIKNVALLAAERLEDLIELDLAMGTLTPDRALLLRYEDVVSDPGLARSRLADFLGVPRSWEPIGQTSNAQLFLPSESDWKEQALAPVDASRSQNWRRRLDRREIRQVEAIVGSQFEQHGYSRDMPGGIQRLIAVGIRDVARVAHSRRSRMKERAYISRVRLGATSPDVP